MSFFSVWEICTDSEQKPSGFQHVPQKSDSLIWTHDHCSDWIQGAKNTLHLFLFSFVVKFLHAILWYVQKQQQNLPISSPITRLVVHVSRPDLWSICLWTTSNMISDFWEIPLFDTFKINIYCWYFQTYAQEENRLLQHISKFEQQMEYLTKLINIINVQNLTQVKYLTCFNELMITYR